MEEGESQQGPQLLKGDFLFHHNLVTTERQESISTLKQIIMVMCQGS